MNCKQGDLAIYLGKHKFAVGSVVRCVRLMDLADRLDQRNKDVDEPAWRVSPSIKRKDGTFARFASDKALRPIRDQDGEDEILRIAGYPNKEIA